MEPTIVVCAEGKDKNSKKIVQNTNTVKIGFDFYSLSMNSSAVGGSGDRPFLFLVSAIRFAWIDFGIGVHALK